MKRVGRIYGAIKKYLIHDTKYFFLYSYRYFQNSYCHDCKFYSDKELTDLIEKGKSIIRIGDGEIDLIHYLSIGYQVYSDAIRNDFIKIIKNYNDDSKYILMIPLFTNYTNTELKKVTRFQVFMPLKISYEMIFNKKVKYFDAHAFYRDGGFEKLVLPYAKTKQIIIITNEENKEKIKKSRLSSDTYLYVICKNKNTYETRLQIQNDFTDLISKKELRKENVIILMSAGLCKTIIYDMSCEGYQVLDIGRGLESYYTKTSIENAI